MRGIFVSGMTLILLHGAASQVRAHLDSLIQAYMQTNYDPGLAACIVKEDRIIWEGYYGYASLSDHDSVGPGTIFELASVSKTVAGTALMQLCEHGRFKLDDSVNAYLPFPVRNPSFPSSVVTFRQLLCHVSSIRDATPSGSSPGDFPMALGTFLQQYLVPGGMYYSTNNYNSSHPPGTVYEYCNIGAALCGYLVEVISGIPFDQYCRDSIFLPLGMTNTAWFLKDLDQDLIAHPYTFTGLKYYDYGQYGIAPYPAAQLRTTVRSLARFLMAHIGYGRLNDIRILDSATVWTMRRAQYPSLSTIQGLLWMARALETRTVYGHAGGMSGVRTGMYLDEQRRTGALLLANFSPDITSYNPLFQAFFDFADNFVVNVEDRTSQAEMPIASLLEQNYPNPFNPVTIIKYTIAGAGKTTLTVHDLLGRQVKILVDEHELPGNFEVAFDGSGLASGVYIYRLTSGSSVQARRMLLLK